MNPADIAAAPAATEITILSMFWTAHIVVKIVMLCLLGASVWCWAIIIDKTLLLRRLRKANERFEESFWSGNSLEDLFAKLSERPTTGNATLFVSAMREWKRSFQNSTASFMGLQARIEKVLDVSIVREVEKIKSNLLVHRNSRLCWPLCRIVWNCLGHHDFIPLDCGVKEHLSCRCRAGYCRSSAGDCNRPFCSYSSPYRL